MCLVAECYSILFTSEGRMERKIDRWISAVSAVLRSQYPSVLVKKELNRKAKLSIYLSISILPLYCCPDLWVMTGRMVHTSDQNGFPP